MNANVQNRNEPFGNGKAGARPKAAPASSSATPAVPPPPPAPPPPATGPAPESPPAPKPATEERYKAGQFQPGCKPGPGNPFAKRVAALRKSLLDSVSEADVAKLGQRLLAQALAGDVVATKLLLSYLIGRPGPAADPDRLALEAVRLIMSWPTSAEALAVAGAVRPEAVIELVERWAPDCPEAILEDSANPATLEGMERIRRRRENKGK
jgi:hypothetical protein